MSRGKASFRESEVTRAVKAVKKAGVEVARVEVENGKIIVIAGKPADSATNDKNEWDEAVYGTDQTLARQ